MTLPWTDGQFLTVTSMALGALVWLLWPSLQAAIAGGAKPGAPPCARCAAGAAASCAKAPALVAPRDDDGTPLVSIGGRRSNLAPR